MIIKIILIVLATLILIGLIIGKIVHLQFFGKRFKKDDDITLYTYTEFNLKRKEIFIGNNKKYLKGYLYYKESYNKNKIIVYSHGMFSNHESYMQDISYFALKGYLVLGFDYYGTDISSGRNLNSFGNSLRSLDDAIKYIKSDKELSKKEIYVVGHSWGGFSTINIVKYHKDIKGICAISPFVSTFKLIYSFVPKYFKILAFFIYVFELINGGKYSTLNAVKSIKDYKGRILVIQSTDDYVVKFDIGLGYIKKYSKNERIKYIVKENRGHNPNYTDQAISTMKEFYTKISTLSPEEAKIFKQNFDFHKMGELDSLIMDDICDYVIEGKE